MLAMFKPDSVEILVVISVLVWHYSLTSSVGTSPPFFRARAFEPFAQPVRALNELLSLATYNKSLSIVQIQMVNSVEHTLMLVVVTYTSF